MSERTRGIIVQPVTVPDGALWAYGPYARHAVGFDHEGQAFLICEEGVGHAIDSDQFDLCKLDGDPIDLADHIRTFGARLDSNHYQWVRRLGGTFVVTGRTASGRRMSAIRTQRPQDVLDALPNGTSGNVWWQEPGGHRVRISDYTF